MKFIFNFLLLITIAVFSGSLFAKPVHSSEAKVVFEQHDSSCRMKFHGKEYRCAIGRSGVVEDKKEGDGGTPVGTFKIRKIYYRPDRINPAEIKTDIPLVALSEDDGWADDVNSPEYNKYVKLPFEPSHENLWRDDHVYDIIAVIGYNDDPVVNGKGSAIFLHVAKENYSPTAGCIALEKNDLLNILSQFTKNDEIVIEKARP